MQMGGEGVAPPHVHSWALPVRLEKQQLPSVLGCCLVQGQTLVGPLSPS